MVRYQRLAVYGSVTLRWRYSALQKPPMHNEDLARAAEAAIASGALGRSDVLRRLFDFLLERSQAGAAPKEAEVALTVFGEQPGSPQDASVRVYIHRLRHKLGEFYAGPGATEPLRIEIPMGEYRLVVRRPASDAAPVLAERATRWKAPVWLGLAVLLVVLNLGAWAYFWARGSGDDLAKARRAAPWTALLAAHRPITLVVGDYYIFGDVDPAKGVDRLVREYAINNPLDLDDYRMSHPGVRSNYTDLDLHYLPIATAQALRSVMPLLARTARDRDLVHVVKASDLTADMLRRNDIVYVGYLSGLGLLRDPVFAGSRFTVGETWDVLIDQVGKRRFASQEGGPSNPGQQSDLGYVSAFHGPGGNRIVVIAGARDMGLAQAAENATSAPALAAIRNASGAAEAFEALYEVQGFQRSNVGGKLVLAAPLRSERIWSSAPEAQAFPKG